MSTMFKFLKIKESENDKILTFVESKSGLYSVTFSAFKILEEE